MRSAAQHPQDSIDETPVVSGSYSNMPLTARQKVLYALPLGRAEFRTVPSLLPPPHVCLSTTLCLQGSVCLWGIAYDSIPGATVTTVSECPGNRLIRGMGEAHAPCCVLRGG